MKKLQKFFVFALLMAVSFSFVAAAVKTSEQALILRSRISDENGKVGKLYGAKSTPHMFIIDKTGALIYQGAIDDQPTTNKADIKIAKNYVDLALNEAMAEKPVTTAVTEAYGCSVKY